MHRFIYYCCILITINLHSQDSAQLKIYQLPALSTPLFDFENIENIFSLLPINGGLFCPESNSWYKIPDERKYMSVSYLSTDSSVTYSLRSDKGSYILHHQLTANLQLKVDSSWLTDAGFYFVKQINKDTVVYGGLTKGYYSVFQLTKQKSTLLFSYKGRINNIQIKDANSFFFQEGNKIFYFQKGYKPICIYSSKHFIDGFGFDLKMNLYISRKEGVFKIKKQTASLVLPFIHGPLKINGNYLYVLSLQESEFVRLRL